MFLENRYACPKILTILEEELNVIAGGTCWKNRKDFPGEYDHLTITRISERVILKLLYNDFLHLDDTQWNDYKTLQLIRSIMKREKIEVT